MIKVLFVLGDGIDTVLSERIGAGQVNRAPLFARHQPVKKQPSWHVYMSAVHHTAT